MKLHIAERLVGVPGAQAVMVAVSYRDDRGAEVAFVGHLCFPMEVWVDLIDKGIDRLGWLTRADCSQCKHPAHLGEECDVFVPGTESVPNSVCPCGEFVINADELLTTVVYDMTPAARAALDRAMDIEADERADARAEAEL